MGWVYPCTNFPYSERGDVYTDAQAFRVRGGGAPMHNLPCSWEVMGGGGSHQTTVISTKTFTPCIPTEYKLCGFNYYMVLFLAVTDWTNNYSQHVDIAWYTHYCLATSGNSLRHIR